ncbi:hypothetical protein Pfo_015212 [Paulownia fortunei]|nr:hypothetical protein Pfo_015212 [Paulownia fortunei]
MESQEEDNSLPYINVQESNAAMEITSENNNEGIDLEVENIFENKCNYCKTGLKAPPSYGTTHLKKYYERTCKKRPRKMDTHQSLMMANKKISGQERNTHIFNQEDSRHELARMVILHDYPLSMVETIGFRIYSTNLQPCFNMISRNTLKNDCYKLLDKLKCRITITTDMWTSNNTKKGFMAILQNCILRFVCVPAPHTAEVLSNLIVESFMDWNIDRKVSTNTVDNCTTNDAMIHLLSDKLLMRDLSLNGKALHMCCCAHILNLIVKNGLEIISGAIERKRDSVIYWTALPSRVEKIEEIARQLHISCTKKLSLNCKTHWNSTYLMLKTAIIYRDVFPRVKCRKKYYKNPPTNEDWENAIEICGKLKFFYQVAEMFFDEWMKNPNMMIQCMAEKMLAKYEKYWDPCYIMMGVVAGSNPRYKMKLVEFYFQLIYGKFKYPNLQKMARDILVIPVSTVASESAFSSSGRLVCPHHSRLHPTTLEAMMCSHR